MLPEDIAEIIAALNQAGVIYVVVGGLAVNYWGYNRPTKDLDIVLKLEDTNVRAAMGALAALGFRPRIPVPLSDFASEANRKRWRLEKDMLVFQVESDRFREIPIDVFVEEPFDVSEQYAAGPRGKLAEGVFMPIVTYEALRTLKLVANRDVDQVDLRRLALVHGEAPDER